jgi:hypothetical protein
MMMARRPGRSLLAPLAAYLYAELTRGPTNYWLRGPKLGCRDADRMVKILLTEDLKGTTVGGVDRPQ